MKRFTLRNKFTRSIFLLFAVLLALPISSPVLARNPGGDFPPPEGTEWGTAVEFGGGELQTFVTVDSEGMPVYVGLYLTAAVLSDLPMGASDGQWDVLDAEGNVVIPCCGYEAILDYPESASVTPFKHFVLNWNPMGHMPAGVYDKPHFDLHFYVITNEERMAIPAATADEMCMVPNPPGTPGEHPVAVSCATFEEGMMPLPEDQMPAGYINAGAVEPGMGNHLINAAAPELSGEPFQYTWIYGTYGGKVTFYEPMITLEFLEEQNEEVCADITMPARMGEAGYYPTQYCMRYLADQDAYAVTLESFVHYDAETKLENTQ